MGNKKASKICVICGDRPATTSDHIPPRALFPKPRPNDLITVPACVPCNNGSSTDDEAFRVQVSLHLGHDQPAARDLWKKGALRSLRHNKRLRSEMIGNAKKVEIHSKEGIYLGERVALPLHARPHLRVVNRIVHGLYYHHFGEIPGRRVRVKSGPLRTLEPEIVSLMQSLSFNSIGNNAFVYRYGRAEDSKYDSIWFLLFYKRYMVYAVTEPKKRSNK